MIPNSDRLTALRQLALEIATMLPKDDTEARKVLGLALQIVDGFLAPGDEADVVALCVVGQERDPDFEPYH